MHINRSSLLIISILSTSTNAFVSPISKTNSAIATTVPSFSRRVPSISLHAENERGSFDPLNLSSDNDMTTMTTTSSSSSTMTSAAALMTMATVLTTTPTVASAAGPDWGLFEGRTGSLLHPIMMGSMFLFSLSTAFLGWQYRRQRTIGDDIKALQSTLPSFEGSSLSAAIAALESSEDVDRFDRINTLKAALPIESQIEELKTERKELTKSGNREKHYNQGAILAFLGTAFAIEGPLNTYARAGKLFPGPHLYAGAGLVVLWAAAAACVPFMQKGNDTARSIHIAANASGMGLFAWQVVSGWPILMKVVEKTSWP